MKAKHLSFPIDDNIAVLLSFCTVDSGGEYTELRGLLPLGLPET